ncbi:MAG: hypothetical protein HC830_00165 [Bacteroidetes bacterium]|nr:hypothetical protein [Bacteroidota bacterium]
MKCVLELHNYNNTLKELVCVGMKSIYQLVMKSFAAELPVTKKQAR